jgi:hypothetical protein
LQFRKKQADSAMPNICNMTLLLTLLLHTALASGSFTCDSVVAEAKPVIEEGESQSCWIDEDGVTCDYCCNPANAGTERDAKCWADPYTYHNCCVKPLETATTTVPSENSGGDSDSASSHGDPIIHTFKGECYDLNKDGLYLASSHPHWNHDIKVAVYNNFIREFQITSKDDQILFSVNNLNEVTGSWAHGLKHIYRMCTPFNWKECEFSFHEYRFDAQIFMYGVQILFHDYLDPALQKGQRGVHLDIYPRLYEKRKQTFNAEEWDGIYFVNPLPQELAYCPGNSPRRS